MCGCPDWTVPKPRAAFAPSHPLRLLMLTTSDTEEEMRRALDAGALGYVLKNSSAEELITALLSVHRGERWQPKNVVERPVDGLAEIRLCARINGDHYQVGGNSATEEEGQIITPVRQPIASRRASERHAESSDKECADH